MRCSSPKQRHDRSCALLEELVNARSPLRRCRSARRSRATRTVSARPRCARPPTARCSSAARATRACADCLECPPASDSPPPYSLSNVAHIPTFDSEFGKWGKLVNMLTTAELMAFLPSDDLERARRFFTEVIGLPLVEDSPYACVFAANGTLLRVTLVEQFVRPP